MINSKIIRIIPTEGYIMWCLVCHRVVQWVSIQRQQKVLRPFPSAPVTRIPAVSTILSSIFQHPSVRLPLCLAQAVPPRLPGAPQAAGPLPSPPPSFVETGRLRRVNYVMTAIRRMATAVPLCASWSVDGSALQLEARRLVLGVRLATALALMLLWRVQAKIHAGIRHGRMIKPVPVARCI